MHTIAIADTADIPSLVALLNAGYRGEGSKQGWTTEADLLAGPIRTDEAHLLSLMESPTAVFLKCLDAAGHIEGCVYLDQRDRGLYLGMLCVWPQRQGAGIGKQLLVGAEEHARRLGCETIFMQVVSERPELEAWYLRQGYYFTGERRPFDVDHRYGLPTRELEFIIMEKRVATFG